MKQKFTEVVEAFTQEHWDAILKYANSIRMNPYELENKDWLLSEQDSHINLNKGQYITRGVADCYVGEGYQIISFEEFSKKYLGVSEKPAQVGDIDSNTKGSGARYNNGKPDYSLLVISDIVSLLNTNYGLSPHYDTIVEVIVKLGVFQKTHDVKYLYYALEHLGLEAIEESTHVFTYGAAKYAQWNWIKGMQWSVPLACAVRHSLKILNGEDVDDESGRRHIGHIVCNIMMLLHYTKYYKEGNDLPLVEYFNDDGEDGYPPFVKDME